MGSEMCTRDSTVGKQHAAPPDDGRAAPPPHSSEVLEPVHVPEAPQTAKPDDSIAGAPDARGGSAPSIGASTLGKRTHYECDICEKSFLFTQLDIMRHQAAHRAAGDG